MSSRYDERIKSHLDRVVRGTVEETLNALLDAEADRLCNAQRYERSAARRDTRAGHYERGLQTKAGEVRLRVSKLRQQTFETTIIERYRRRESSVEEKRSWVGEVRNVSLQVAIGVNESGYREILGLRAGKFWEAVYSTFLEAWYCGVIFFESVQGWSNSNQLLFGAVARNTPSMLLSSRQRYACAISL
jgi:transposase-like protein